MEVRLIPYRNEIKTATNLIIKFWQEHNHFTPSYEDAYSDFTYIIGHCAQKKEAFFERLFLNYEINNYYEAITDANVVLTWDENNFEVKRMKLLSLVFSSIKRSTPYKATRR